MYVRLRTNNRYSLTDKGDYMSYMLDLGILALFALFVYSGIKRGILYMAINAGGTIVSAVIAPFLASLLSLSVYNMMFKQSILNMVNDAVAAIPHATAEEQASGIFGGLNSFALNVLSGLGIDEAALSEEIAHSRLEAADIVEGFIRPAAVRMVSTVLTLIIFVILMVIVSFLAVKLSKTISKTKLSIPNKIFGGIVGAAEALLIVMIMSLIIYFIMMFMPADNYQQMQEGINNTWFYKYIYEISLPDKIITWLNSGLSV